MSSIKQIKINIGIINLGPIIFYRNLFRLLHNTELEKIILWKWLEVKSHY